MWVQFGNDAAVEGYKDDGDDEVKFRDIDGQQITYFEFPEGTPLLEAFQTAAAGVQGPQHMSGTDPKWVMSDSDGLAGLLAEHFSADGTPCKVVDDIPASWASKAIRENPQLPSVKALAAAGADAEEG